MSSSPEASASTSPDLAKDAPSKPTLPSGKKGGLSCAECRRSKLRCDREVPCGACKKRGCAALCPDKTLVATKGNKVLQSQNQNLQDAVKRLTTRIRDLETALSSTQSQITAQPHPLLQESATNRENEALMLLLEGGSLNGASPEEVRDAFGSLSIGEQGQAKFHGQSAGSGFFQQLLPTGGEDPYRETGLSDEVCDKHNYGLPYHILELVYAFPFGRPNISPETKQEILQFLPTREKAMQLASNYFDTVATSYRPLRYEDFTLITDKIYNHPSRTVWDDLHSHQLAVFFFVIAIGNILQEDAYYAKALAERYCALGRASISIDSPSKDASVYTLFALFVLTQYYELSDRTTNECQWQLGGLMSRIAYQIGLQRDPSVWNLNAEETERRRILFWELYTWDSWTSIVYGRPPSLDIRYTDCRFPEDKEGIIGQNGEPEYGYHAWKYRFAAAGLSQIVQHIFGMKSHDYASLLELDRNLRKIQLPASLQSPTTENGEPSNGKAWSTCPQTALMQFSAICAKESVLLYVHRRFFARALRLNPRNPLETKYGASVMAAYRSCCLIIQGLQSLCAKHLPATQRMSHFFSSAFSSCVVLSCMIYNSPACPLTKSALDILDIGVGLFTKQASKATHCPLTAELLVTMQTRNHEGYENYLAYTQGRNDSYRLPDHTNPQCNFMRVLEGFTTVINSQKSPETSSNGSSPRGHSPPSPREQDSMFEGPIGGGAGGYNGDANMMQQHQMHASGSGPSGPSSSNSSSSGHSPQQQQFGYDYSAANGVQHQHQQPHPHHQHHQHQHPHQQHDPMQHDGSYYGGAQVIGEFGVPQPMYDAPPHVFVQPTMDLLTAAGLPQTAQAGPFALPQSFPIPQAPHMQNGVAGGSASGGGGVLPYHQGAADLTIELPPETDAAAWDKIFAGYGGRLA